MSSPSPDIQVKMLEEMLLRKYKFNIGDKVKLVRLLCTDADTLEGSIFTVWFPYFYYSQDYTGKYTQAYILRETPIPFTENEMELIEASGKTQEDTIKYLQEEIKGVVKNGNS